MLARDDIDAGGHHTVFLHDPESSACCSNLVRADLQIFYHDDLGTGEACQQRSPIRDEPDLGAFIYAIRRLPDRIVSAELVIMGQEAEVFARNGVAIDEWEEADAPARRRRWHDSGEGMHAVLLASASAM